MIHLACNRNHKDCIRSSVRFVRDAQASIQPKRGLKLSVQVKHPTDSLVNTKREAQF